MCAPTALVCAAGVSAPLNDKYYEVIQNVTLENGLVIRLVMWHVPSTQITYSMMDLMFGAAVGDATAGEVLITA